MYDKSLHGFCTEFYTIEKSIEVVVKINGTDTRIRIDALKDEIELNFSTNSYVEENLKLQPTYPIAKSAHQQAPQDYRVWVKMDNDPWTRRYTADEAIQQALSFLSDSFDH